MKQLHLVSKNNDGGRSARIVVGLLGALIPYRELHYAIDSLPWKEIRDVPCVVIDVDGSAYDVLYDVEDPVEIRARFDAAPSSLPPAPAKVPDRIDELLSLSPPSSITATEQKEMIQQILRIVSGRKGV